MNVQLKNNPIPKNLLLGNCFDFSVRVSYNNPISNPVVQ